MSWIKKHKILSVIILIILLIAVSGIIKKRKSANTLLTEPLKTGTIIESVYGIGTITAVKSFQVKVTVNNTIQRLFVKEGDFVKKGQRLVIMDAGNFSAPFDGTITYLPFKEGENVFANSIVLSLVDLTDRYLVVTLEQQGALRVRHGQKARLSFDSMRSESFEGVVQSVYSNDNSFLVRIDVPNIPPQILPGMTADVAIGINEKKNVLLAPIAALDSDKVYKKNDFGAAEEFKVKLGIADGEMVEIISDEIKEGDRLLIKKKLLP
ncbi:MAG: efflux RND transporter periplasmic adaptor subunit [Oligoflexia bacterium]|nr:efflux RND transporter periplasmic adaptor subunit [Oligoflexia bacterium]